MTDTRETAEKIAEVTFGKWRDAEQRRLKLADAIDEALRNERERQWQLIETAPKTGERILLAHGSSVWEDEWWNGNGTNGNWVECVNETVGYRGEHANEIPTHWQPLPDPPVIHTPKENEDDPEIQSS